MVVGCVRVIQQRAFLRDSNELNSESCNASMTQHSTIAKLARILL